MSAQWQRPVLYHSSPKGVLESRTSSQDRDLGRYALLPPTKKRRTTANLKTKNNQNCLKIELYGSPANKELRKKYSSRQLHDAAKWVAPPWKIPKALSLTM